jgi:hypothetical protein
MRKRAEMRASRSVRYWHVGLCAAVGVIAFGIVDCVYLRGAGELPGLKSIWPLAVLVPLVCGAVVTLGCGGALLWKRIVAAGLCGTALGLLYTAVSAVLVDGLAVNDIVTACAWRAFVFAILATIGAIITELKLPEPGQKI